jgi:hypothetical protein
MLFGLPTGLAILVSRLAMHMRAFYEGILATRDFHWYCPWQMPARIACPAIENMLVDRHEASDGLVDVRPLPKPVGYNWSYWNAGRAHLVPILQPFTGSSFKCSPYCRKCSNFTSKPKRWRAGSSLTHVRTTMCIRGLAGPARARPDQGCQKNPWLSKIHALPGMLAPTGTGW